MGDKTQFLAIILSARTRRPWAVLAGVGAASLLSLGLAAFLGGLLSVWIKAAALRWLVGLGFMGFAVWMLFPEQSEAVEPSSFANAFLTTAGTIFVAELGDKAQIAVLALGAHYHNLFLVTAGSTFGMLAADGLAVAFGDRITAWLPLKWLRLGASLLFFGLGLAVLIRH